LSAIDVARLVDVAIQRQFRAVCGANDAASMDSN